MEASKKKFLAIILTLTTFLAMPGILGSIVVSTEYIDVDDYCWIEGDSIDIGFSKYGEMIGYNENTETGLGLQYPGYSSAGDTYDQTDDTSVDPFCNEYSNPDWWMNGWFIDIKYTPVGGPNREIWAFAMFSDGQQHGGDWIKMPSTAATSSVRPLWQEYPPYANPDVTPYIDAGELPSVVGYVGGRKTNGYCETDPINITYNGPEKLVAICKTRISDTSGPDLVDLYFTFIFNKAERNVIILKDVKRLYMKSPLNIQFGNRGEWDLGLAGDIDSYIHWYTSEPVQYWDTDGDGTINGTEVETTFEIYKDYFLTNKHPEKWWDEVPEDERPTTVYNEWSEEMGDFPQTWLEAQEGCYGLEGHIDDTIKNNSYAVAQVITAAGDYVGALAVWPHPEFWSPWMAYYPPARTVVPEGNNPSILALMLAPISRMLEWHKWTVEEDPNQGGDDDLYDRDDVWVKADDIRMPDGTTLEPIIPFTIYEHDFELRYTLPEYRIVSVYVLTDRHDADDADAGLWEPWSSGLNVIDSEVQQQLDEIFNPTAHPVASFTYSPESPLVDRMVTFNASASYDPDGNITSYFWNFGDGTNGTEIITTHVYTTAGTYNVTLTVTDDEGLTDTCSRIVEVVAPLATEVYFNLNPNPVGVGETVTLKGILVDELSQPLSNETVRLYARPLAGSWRYITSLATNKYGILMWQATVPQATPLGVYIFAVYYPGSESYESSYNFAILIIQ